jgi:hypothetical protein
MTQIARIGQMLLCVMVVVVKAKCKMILFLDEGSPDDSFLFGEQVHLF